MWRCVFAGILGLCVVSCATRAKRPTTAQAPIAQSPATAPADPKASLALDEIEPRPELPSAPATAPGDPAVDAARPPIEALELYARARDALAGGKKFTAISSLEKAITLDPESAELHRLLSRAYLSAGNASKSIDALLRAVEIDPRDARSHTALGRLYLLRNDPASATRHLRTAMQTNSYTDDEAAAAVIDYLLARALQQQGYDRAALERYESLLERLRRPTFAFRSEPELGEWAARPEAIWSDVARLYERRGQLDRALQTWRLVAEHDTDDLDARQRVVNLLIALGRGDEALADAAETVRRSGASSRSIEILRDVAKKIGREDAAYDELRRVLAQKPEDRALLFALVDLLSGDGRTAEAETMLIEAARDSWDGEVVRRLVRFYSEQSRADAAATVIIEASAARPRNMPQLQALFEGLLSPTRKDSLRAAVVEKLAVSPGAHAAKDYFVAYAAFAGSRRTLMRESLDRAIAAAPQFAPALWFAMQRTWHRTDIDEQGKKLAAQELIDRAIRAKNSTLADELRGYSLYRQRDLAGAEIAWESAIKSGDAAPEPAMLYALLQLERQNTQRFEQTLWRIISDHPEYGPAYVHLINHYLNGRAGGASVAANVKSAGDVLQKWLNADPSSVPARLARVQVLSQTGQTSEAVTVVRDLVRENRTDSAVINQAGQIYLRANSLGQFVPMLEDELARAPENFSVAVELVRYYSQVQRPDDANRVIGVYESAAQGDARMLILVSQLYNLVGAKEKVTATLEAALRLDPNDPGVNNDLGYTWAEAGKNLSRAESMTRLAVSAEPDNPSFLDSLGWVLYKLGRFEEARQQLEAAVSATDETSADAVMFDHLGDALYRLQERDAARAQWQRSLERLATRQPRDDDDVRSSIEAKIRQHELGEPVNVAPVDGVPVKQQAKN